MDLTVTLSGQPLPVPSLNTCALMSWNQLKPWCSALGHESQKDAHGFGSIPDSRNLQGGMLPLLDTETDSEVGLAHQTGRRERGKTDIRFPH